MRVADRFGDFGLTGVGIAVCGPLVWHLDSFLLSCRVIGKSVETALLAHHDRRARMTGGDEASERIRELLSQVLDVPGGDHRSWVLPRDRVFVDLAQSSHARVPD